MCTSFGKTSCKRINGCYVFSEYIESPKTTFVPWRLLLPDISTIYLNVFDCSSENYKLYLVRISSIVCVPFKQVPNLTQVPMDCVCKRAINVMVILIYLFFFCRGGGLKIKTVDMFSYRCYYHICLYII